MKRFRYLIILALVGTGLLTAAPVLPVTPAFAGPSNVTFKGDVFTYNNQPAVGVTVCIYGTSNQCQKTTSSSSSNDSASCPQVAPFTHVCSVWSFSVPSPSTEQVQVKADPGDSANSSYPNFPQSLNLLSTDTVTITNNYALNLVTPLQAVNVHVQDDYGAAVGGVKLKASAQAKEFDVNGGPTVRRLLLGKAIVALNLISPGSYYQSAPTVSFGGGGSGADATATIAGPVAAVDLNSAGGLCTSVPSVTFDPPSSGSTATGHATATTSDGGLTYTVTGVAVDSGGSGYSSQPGVHFNGGGCTPIATALINGSVNSLTLNDGGSGYDPTLVSVSFSGGTSASPTVTTTQATASATVGLASSGSSSYDDQATGPVSTDGGGNYTLYLLPSTLQAGNYEYNICGYPDTNSNWGYACTNGVDVTLDKNTPTSVTVVVPRKVHVNGYVLAPPGLPSQTNGLAGVKVCYAGTDGQSGNPSGQGSACTTTSSLPNQSKQLLGPAGGSCDGDTSHGGFTFATGCPYSYSLSVVPGSYVVQLSADYGDITAGEHAPQKFTIISTQNIVFGRTPPQVAACGWSSQVSGSGGATPPGYYDACWYEPITLPEVADTVTVQKADNTLLANIPMNASSKSMEIPAQGSNSTIDGVPWSAQASYDSTKTGNVLTGNNGQAVLYLFPEPQNSSTFNYNVTAVSNQLGLSTTTISQFVTPATNSATIVMTQGATISGNITDADGQPVAGVTVSLETKQGLGPADQTASTVTDSNGHYKIVVQPGAYFMKVSANPGDGAAGAAQTVLIETAPATATRSTGTPTFNLGNAAVVTQNLTLPVWQVDVETVDPGSTPLAGSSIDAQSKCPQTNLPLTNSGGIAGVIVTAGGNYPQVPTVSFSGGGGSGAAGFVNLDPKTHAVSSVTITNPGTGYSSASPPTVTFSPSGATGTAVVGLGGQGCTSYDHTKAAPAVTTNGAVTSVTVTNPGTGYFNPPTVTFDPPPSGTTATGLAAVDPISGHVLAIDITNPGSGYTSAPVVHFAGAGTNAAATATIGTAATLFLLDTHYAGQTYTFTAYPTVSPYVTTTMASVPITGDMTVAGGNPLIIHLKTPVAFGGTIMGSNSAPAENVTVSLLNAATSSQSGPSNVVESATTDVNGNFSFPNKVPPQPYILKLSANPGDGQVNAPQQFSMQTTTFALDLTGGSNTTFSLTLPQHQVMTTVQDPVGNPVSGAPLAAAATCPETGLSAGGMTFTGCSTYAFGVPGELDTDPSGHATLWLLNSTSSSYTLMANPPGGSNLLPSMVNNVATTSDQNQTITLQVPVLVSGTIVAGDGVTPATHVTVGVESAPGGKPIASGITDSNGAFSFTAPSTVNVPGDYFKISTTPGGGQTGAPQTLLVETRSPSSIVPNNLAQATMNLQTITLPEDAVTVHVNSASPVGPLANVKVSAQAVACPETGPTGAGISLSDAGGALNNMLVNACSTYGAFAAGATSTDGTGTASLWLVPTTPAIGLKKANTYTITVYPPSPAVPQYLQGTRTLVAVNANPMTLTPAFSLAHR